MHPAMAVYEESHNDSDTRRNTSASDSLRCLDAELRKDLCG